MNNQVIAKLIADNLGHLTHPGNPAANQPALTPLLPFKTAGMPPQLAEHVNTTAQLIGEAIVELIEGKNGDHTIIANNELQQLREQAAANDPDAPPPAKTLIQCPHGNPILELVPQSTVKLSAAQHAALTRHECEH